MRFPAYAVAYIFAVVNLSIANGLVASISAKSSLSSHDSRNLSVNSTLANGTQLSAAAASEDAVYYSCKGSECTVNTTKMNTELNSGLILFFGCSLDILAIKWFCRAAHSELYGFTDNFAYMAHCTVGGFTMVYVYHPGASLPPYFHGYVGTLTTNEIVDRSAHDIVLKFGQRPTAIVVDSSLWDVSNWWQKSGFPPEPYPVPSPFIAHWCQMDLPNLLLYIGAAYPEIPIAYRTPPPVFVGNEYGQSPQIIDAMNQCINEKVEFLSKKVYSKYKLIDFYGIVKKAFLHTTDPQSIYRDVLHPGQELSLSYVNHVLQWVRGMGPR
jgi:hypothetical protein